MNLSGSDLIAHTYLSRTSQVPSLPHLHPAPQHQLQQVQDTGTTHHACPTRLSPRLPHTTLSTPAPHDFLHACPKRLSPRLPHTTLSTPAPHDSLHACPTPAPPPPAPHAATNCMWLLDYFCAHSNLSFHSNVPCTLSLTLCSLQPPAQPRSLLGMLVPAPGVAGCGLCGDYERVASSYRGLYDLTHAQASPRVPRMPRRLLPCLERPGVSSHASNAQASPPMPRHLLLCEGSAAREAEAEAGLSPLLPLLCPVLCEAFLCAPPSIPFLATCRVRLTKSTTGIFAYSPISGVGQYARPLAYLRTVVQLAYGGATCVHMSTCVLWGNLRTRQCCACVRMLVLQLAYTAMLCNMRTHAHAHMASYTCTHRPFYLDAHLTRTTEIQD